MNKVKDLRENILKDEKCSTSITFFHTEPFSENEFAFFTVCEKHSRQECSSMELFLSSDFRQIVEPFQ